MQISIRELLHGLLVVVIACTATASANEPSPNALDVTSRYGEAAVLFPDLTGDGNPDLLVTDPGADQALGRIWIIPSGDPDSLVPEPPANAFAVGNLVENFFEMGRAMRVTADFSGDGIADLYVLGRAFDRDGFLVDAVALVDLAGGKVEMLLMGGVFDIGLWWHELPTEPPALGDWGPLLDQGVQPDALLMSGGNNPTDGGSTGANDSPP